MYADGGTGWGVPGGYGDGWVPGEGYTGYYPAARGEVQIQRSGPRKPRRGWSGWYLELGRPTYGQMKVNKGPGTAAGTAPRTTLRARSVPPGALPVLGPSECRLTANRARISLILLKVSQNGEVSWKSVEKACHSPYLQKRSQKSPLDFLRFPFSVAFSHKELMGRF